MEYVIDRIKKNISFKTKTFIMMEDTITINLRALTEEDREIIKEVLCERLTDINDETNAAAINTLYLFIE